MTAEPFWKTKSLEEMNHDEWESLCDGCGRCCLHKLEDDEDSSLVWYTRVACRLLDVSACRCTSYETRTQHVPSCLDLHKGWDNALLRILPTTCAYSLVARGEDLPAWHPLVAGEGSQAAMRDARISVSLFAYSEVDVPDEDLELHIIDLETLTLILGEDDVDEEPMTPLIVK